MRVFYCLYTEGEDYIFSSFTVEFGARVTHVPFNVSINNDNILEGNETFNLTVNSSSLPSEVTVTNRSQVIVTIVDDDGMLIIVFQYYLSLMVASYNNGLCLP